MDRRHFIGLAGGSVAFVGAGYYLSSFTRADLPPDGAAPGTASAIVCIKAGPLLSFDVQHILDRRTVRSYFLTDGLKKADLAHLLSAEADYFTSSPTRQWPLIWPHRLARPATLYGIPPNTETKTSGPSGPLVSRLY